MPLDTVKLGTALTIDTQFYNSDGTVFQPKSPASYVLRDFDGNLVLSGLGAQNDQQPETWQATVTLPKSAPYSNSKKYRLTWTLTGGQGGNSVATTTEQFFVQGPDNAPLTGDIQQWADTELVVTEGDTISDTLPFPSNTTLQSYRIRILDNDGFVYFDQTVSDAQAMDIENQNVYGFTIDQPPGLMVSYRPYAIEWSFTLNGRQEKRYHWLYLVNIKILLYMDRLRQLIDKAHFNHPNPHMRYTEVDLISYLMQGIDIVNYTQPNYTNFNINNFPFELDRFLIFGAAYVALSAQYLAEGVAAFDLSGQSVSLNVDRTASIDSALGRVIDEIRTELPKAKTLISKQSVTGVLLLTPSPSSNPMFYARGGFGGYGQPMNYLGDIFSRSAMYANIVSYFDTGF